MSLLDAIAIDAVQANSNAAVEVLMGAAHLFLLLMTVVVVIEWLSAVLESKMGWDGMGLHCDTVHFAEPSLPGAFVSGTASEPLVESADASATSRSS